jgi:flagellar protein FlgJ
MRSIKMDGLSSININDALWSKEQQNLNNIKSDIKRNTNDLKGQSFENMLKEKIGKDGKVKVENLNKKEKKLYDSCIEMESFLWKNVLNSMKSTINKYKLIDGGLAEDFFTDMLYDEYAMMCAKSSSSNLASTMFEQLSRSM